jgi:hypothetical protein
MNGCCLNHSPVTSFGSSHSTFSDVRSIHRSIINNRLFVSIYSTIISHRITITGDHSRQQYPSTNCKQPNTG